MRKGKSAEIAKRDARRMFDESARDSGKECASFTVIPAIERESPNVCENTSKSRRNLCWNSNETLKKTYFDNYC